MVVSRVRGNGEGPWVVQPLSAGLILQERVENMSAYLFFLFFYAAFLNGIYLKLKSNSNMVLNTRVCLGAMNFY